MAGNKTAKSKTAPRGPETAPWNEPTQTDEPNVVTTEAGKEAVVQSFRDFNMKKEMEADPVVHYPFVYPGRGDTGFWLKIRSQYSKAYRDADLKAQRQISSMIIAQGGDVSKVDPELMADIRLRAFTKLVKEWNFPDPMTEDNLVEFFTTNEIAYDEVNNLAAQDSLFFSKSAKS